MTPNLNIPLAPASSAVLTRSVWRLMPIVLGLCAALLLFRLPWCLGVSARNIPEDTALALRLLRTPENLAILGEKSTQSSTQTPWTLAELLRASRKEMTIFFLANGQLAFGLDRPLTEDFIRNAASFGWNVVTYGHASILTQGPAILEDEGPRLFPSSLLPWSDGQVLVFDHGTFGGASRLSLKSSALTLHGLGYRVSAVHPPRLAQDAVVLAHIALPPAQGVTLPGSFLPEIVSGNLLSLFSQQGSEITLFHDAYGQGYQLRFPATDWSAEDVAALGKSLIDHNVLSTQRLTITDGTFYQEMRADQENVNTTFENENDRVYITIDSTEGERLSLVKTTTDILATNRKNTLESGQMIRSTCLPSAHSWLMSAALSPDAYEQKMLLLLDIKEIAINKDKIRFCW